VAASIARSAAAIKLRWTDGVELPWLAKLKLFSIAHFNIGC
jgi:hypothetical protein